MSVVSPRSHAAPPVLPPRMTPARARDAQVVPASERRPPRHRHPAQLHALRRVDEMLGKSAPPGSSPASSVFSEPRCDESPSSPSSVRFSLQRAEWRPRAHQDGAKSAPGKRRADRHRACRRREPACAARASRPHGRAIVPPRSSPASQSSVRCRHRHRRTGCDGVRDLPVLQIRSSWPAQLSAVTTLLLDPVMLGGDARTGPRRSRRNHVQEARGRAQALPMRCSMSRYGETTPTKRSVRGSRQDQGVVETRRGGPPGGRAR